MDVASDPPSIDSAPVSRTVTLDREGDIVDWLVDFLGIFFSSESLLLDVLRVVARGDARGDASFSSLAALGFGGVSDRAGWLDLTASSFLAQRLDDDLLLPVLIRMLAFFVFGFSLSVPFSSRSSTGVPRRDDD